MTSGRVRPKSSGFGFGFGYCACAYYGPKDNSLIILCNSISCKGTELKSECYSDNVEKELKNNQYTFISSTDSHIPIQNHSVGPKKEASKVWRYFGDNIDGAIAKCL